MSRVLVAGVGNIFLTDDGFGSAVAQQLRADASCDAVTVADFGIRGVHLAYELLDGYDALVLIDAVSRGDPPGTVSVIDVTGAPGGIDALDAGDGVLAAMDAHGMNPAAVLAMVSDLGGQVGQVLVVACEAGCVDEGIGLSEPVAAAVPAAVDAVKELICTFSKEAAP